MLLCSLILVVCFGIFLCGVRAQMELHTPTFVQKKKKLELKFFSTKACEQWEDVGEVQMLRTSAQ